MPFDENAHLLHIVLLGAQAIVLVTNSLTDLFQQPCGAQHRKGAGFMVKFGTVFLYRTNTVNLGYKPLSAFFAPI